MIRFIFIYFLTLLTIFELFSTNNRFVVNEMIVVDNGNTHRYNYLYTSQMLPQTETKWQKINNIWQKVSLKEWYYEQHLPASVVERKWTTSGWIDTCKIEVSATANGYNETKQLISNNAVFPISKTEIVVQNNQIIEEKRYAFTNEHWILQNKINIFYSKYQHPDSSIFVSYKNEIADDYYKILYSYNNDSTIRTIQTERRKINTNWLKTGRTVYLHNDNLKKPIYIRNEFWNNLTNSWDYFDKTEYEYLDNILQNETYWTWNEMSWKQDLNYKYSYENQNLSFLNTQAAIGREWRNLSTVAHKKTNDQLVIESTFNFWGGVANSNKSDFLMVPFNNETISRKAETITLNYTTIEPNSISNNQTNKSEIIIYPNPSTGIFYIQNANSLKNTWQITDLKGSILRSSNSTNQTSIVDISDFSNGIYILMINTYNQKHVYKLVKTNE